MSLRAIPALVLAATLALAGCGGGSKRTAHRVPVPPPAPPAISTTSGDSPISDESIAEELSGVKDARPIYTEEGMASWYGDAFHNRRKANGEIFDMNAITAAHRTLPLNSVARVTNLKTGSSVLLRITDRGPFVGDRVIDLSKEAAKRIDVWRPGTAKVRIDVLEAPKPIDQGGRWCVQIGALNERDAARLRERLTRRYRTAKVIHFGGPTGDWWVRIRVLDDDKRRALEVQRDIESPSGLAYLVRLD